MKQILLYLSIILCIASCNKKIDKPAIPAQHVDTITVKKQNIAYSLSYPAALSGISDFSLMPRVSGTILNQYYTDGQKVIKDQVLYKIDDRLFKSQLNASYSQLKRDVGLLESNKIIFERSKKLYGIGGIAKQDLELVTKNYQDTLGLVSIDQERIKQDKLNIEYTRVKSPITGVISKHMLSVGATVVAYQSVLNQIYTNDNLYVDFAISEAERLDLIKKINNREIIAPKNYKFGFNLELADGQIIQNAGIVNFTDTRINPQSGTWSLRGIIKNKNNLLSGQFVHITLTGATYERVIAIPQTAIFRASNETFVYIVQNSKAVKKKIILGDMINDLWLVRSGLNDNDKLIISGGLKLMDKAPIVVDK